MTYRPAVRCPGCDRYPAIRYPPEAVERAKGEREGRREQSVGCHWCGTIYWIRARHIADATLDPRSVEG